MDDRYNTGAKSLNTSGGSNRFKFESKKSRAKRVDVDVTHKLRAEGYLDADSTQGLDVHVGSFFQQELDRCKELNATPPFKRFYYKAWPLVQSLPELLHHSTTVVDMILALLENPTVAAQAGEQALQLLSVLGRDLQGSFFPHFRRVSGVLVDLLDSTEVSPEVCGRVLRCLGFLLKFVAKPLAADTNALRCLYAPLLGHRRDFTRRMAAQSLAPAVRRMKPKAMLKHAKHLIQALAAGRADADADAITSAAGKGQAREGARGAEKLCLDVLDGSSQLLFFLLKGVHGRLHSQAPMLLRIIFDSILPPKRGEVDEKTCIDQDLEEARRRGGLRREWCFELARAVLGLVVEHVRSPYSADLWLELHCALGNASTRHQASLAEQCAEREGGDEGAEESAECAAVRRTTDLLSQAVGHMRGILLREDSVAVKQSALLAELLVDLTRSDVFHSSLTSHGCRTAIIDLVVVSLSGLHRQKRLITAMPTVIEAIVVDGTGAGKVGGEMNNESWGTHPALVLTRAVLGGMGSECTAYEPPPLSVTQAVAMPPLMEACTRALLDRRELLFEILMRTIHGARVGLAWRGDDPGYPSAESGVSGEGVEEEGLSSEDKELDKNDDAASLAMVRGGSGAKTLPLSSETAQKLIDLCCSTLKTAAATFDRGADGGERSPSIARGLPTWVAILRCLPCVVGSFDSTETLRLKAARSALESVEKLMVALVEPEALHRSSGDKKMSKKAAARKRSSITKPGRVSEGNAEEPWPWIASRELTILRAFALEAGVGLCCLLPPKTAGLESGDGDVVSMLMEWHGRATVWLKANPRSIATIRAVGLLLRAIRTVSSRDGGGKRGARDDSGYPPCLSSEASLVVIDLLGGNMCSASRLLRLHTARVLAQYEPLPFASEVGRGDGGVDGDGDARSATTSHGGEEACTFLQIAAAVEATPISIATERDLIMRLGQLEVMGRSGRLPSEYVRLMTTYALGLLRNKFSSVWPRAAAIVGALYGRPEQRNIVWQPVSRMLREVMPPPPARDRARSTSDFVDSVGGGAEKASEKRRQAATGRRMGEGETSGSRHVAEDGGKAGETMSAEEGERQNQRQERQRELPCARALISPPRAWLPRLTSTAAEMDQGPREEIDLPPALHGLYLDECVRTGLQPESGEVPLWATTDDDSMFAQVWEVLAQCPELLQQNSRAVVPLFLAFMAYQYLADRAFPDDPEVRAVDIEMHLTADERAFGKPENWAPQGEDPNGREKVECTGEIVARVASRTSVRARLAAILGVFAEVPGPKSLYKQRVLFQVYRALLTVSDEKISKPALRCMLSYKPPFLLPYKTHLEGLLNQENFREELVTFSLESGTGANRDGDKDSGDGKSWLPSSSGSKREREQEDAPGVDPKHRSFLLPVVIRLVYGRLSGPGARGRGGGTAGPAARRSAVLSFLSGLSSEELAELFALMVRPILGPEAQSQARVRGVEDREAPGWEGVGCGSEQALAVLGEVKGATWGHLAGLSSSRLTGFLKMTKDVAKQLGQRALPYVENVLVVVLALLERSNAIEGEGHGARKIEEDVAGAEDMDHEELQEDEKDEDMEEIGTGDGDGGAESSRLVSGASESEGRRRRRLSPRALRALCLRALSELLSQYASSYDFTAHKETLWSLLGDPIARLPGSTIGAAKPPALLSFAVVMVESSSLSRMLSTEIGGNGEGSRGLIPAVIDCISAGSSRKRTADPVVLGSVLNFVERLLVLDGGSLLVPHLDRLISNFSARLNATAAPDKGSGVVGKFDCHMEQVLSILARIAEMASSGDSSGDRGRVKGDGRDVILDASSLAHLMTLLMPALQPERRAPDDAKSSVLRTISALSPRVDAAGARRIWPSLSRLLGPTGSRPSGLAAAAPREALVRALEALGMRPDLTKSVGKTIELLRYLNARDAAALDEPDFAKAVPAYNSLSEGTAWADIVAAGQTAGKPGVQDAPVIALGGTLAASPIAQHCLHAMHDGEVSLRGAAAAALKRLSREIAARERRAGTGGAAEESGRCPWEGLMRTVLMPGLRAGMGCRTEVARKGFISLLRETLSSYNCDDGSGRGEGEGPGVSASLVPSDLWVLAREDDPESDFFLNACHIQVHRRARALVKARKVIEDVETEARAAGCSADSTDSEGRKDAEAVSRPVPMVVDGGRGGDGAAAKAADATAPVCPFRVSTLLNFVLPLALHPLHEATKLSEAGLVDQAVQLIGAVARYLPWTHYNALLRNLMQQVNAPGSGASNSAEKERAMVNAMCAVLNSFHFALISPGADDRSSADRHHGSSQTPEISSHPSERTPGDAADGIADTNDKNAPTDVVLPTTVISAAEEAAARAAADAGDAVWRAVNGRLLGSLRMLLTKEVQAKSGATEKVLRAPVALGILSLLRRLPAEDFVLQLQPLVMTVVQTLKSRESHARDVARETLAKMCRELGPGYLQQVVSELQTCLTTGYQLHVRTFTLHAVLKAVADSYAPPMVPSVDIRSARGDVPSGKDGAVGDRGAKGAAAASANGGGDSDPAMSKSMVPGVGDIDDSSKGSAAVVPAVPSSLVKPAFDACIPDIVELLLEDIFGETATAKEADGHNVASSKIKEAKGQKAYDSFEIMARTLLFRPTFTVLAPRDPVSVSSVHAIVGPVLSRLEGCENPKDVGKANEALTRIGIGLAANPSVTEPEMFLYVHATVAPFLIPQLVDEKEDEEDAELELSDDEDSDSDGDTDAQTPSKRRQSASSSSARMWMASEVNVKDSSRKAASNEKRQQEWDSVRVVDGASAPKHTGQDRHDGPAAAKRMRLNGGGGAAMEGTGGTGGRGVSLSDPAALGAVTLALGLLHSKLKAEGRTRGERTTTTTKSPVIDRGEDEVRAMADPFVPLLTRCVGKNPHTAIVLVSLRSLGYLLRWKLPSMGRCAPIVGRHVLKRLVRGGIGGIRGEMGQACFKTLSALFKHHVSIFAGSSGGGEAPGKNNNKRKSRKKKKDPLFGLSPKQMRALLAVLMMAIAETEHQNATFGLIRAVVSNRVMLPEVYDLMTKLAGLAVTSHSPTMRNTAGQTFLTFLIQYPLGEKRLQFHLSQILNAFEYEHAEGRLAALGLCDQLISRLPEPNLDQLGCLFYLSLVMCLTNDTASECRAASSAAILTLAKRASAKTVHELLDFTGQWFGTGAGGNEVLHVDGADPVALRRTAAQTSGIFLQARPELARKKTGDHPWPWILSELTSLLPPKAAEVIARARRAGTLDFGGFSITPSVVDGAATDDWMCVYHAVIALRKALDSMPRAFNAALSSKFIAGKLGSGVVGEGEKSSLSLPLVSQLLNRLLEALLYPHAWVRLTTARFWGAFFSCRDPETLCLVGSKGDGQGKVETPMSGTRTKPSATAADVIPKGDDGGEEFLRTRRILFRLCQNFCAQLNRSQVDPELNDLCVKNLLFVGRAMHVNPELCFAGDLDDGDDDGGGSDAGEMGLDRAEGDEDEDEDDVGAKVEGEQDEEQLKEPGSKNARDPLRWVFNRMANMVVHKGEARRCAVFTWFAAMASFCDASLTVTYLRLMLLPLRRAVLDAEAGGAESRTRVMGASSKGTAGKVGDAAGPRVPNGSQSAAELANEVMELLEGKVGSAVYLEAFTAVNMDILKKRTERKRKLAVEKATDPVAAAVRRKERTEASKRRKHRKVEEAAKLRGGTKRMRQGSNAGRRKGKN